MGLVFFLYIFAPRIYIRLIIMIERTLSSIIENEMFRGKAIIVIGARQVGKSTLLRMIPEHRTEKILRLNCDEPEVKAMLTDAGTADLKLLVGQNRTVMIDEAQSVPGIGMTLKRLIDNFPEVQLLVTGSSSFELQNKLNEPLTGRKYEHYLFPLSSSEICKTEGIVRLRQTLEQRLIYGSYPEVFSRPEEAKQILMDIARSYLYKDLLALDDIRRPALLEKLLVALALQLSSEVSYNELAQTIGTDNKTVEKYIDLLEKCFVVFRLNGFNRNLRTELKKSKKIYFYDNGIRNAILQNFAPLSMRQDTGALWENFVISERIKMNHYSGSFAKSYFWRTTGQQEIDFIEEKDGQFTLFEMKFNPKKSTVKLPRAFLETYDVERTAVVTPANWTEWLL